HGLIRAWERAVNRSACIIPGWQRRPSRRSNRIAGRSGPHEKRVAHCLSERDDPETRRSHQALTRKRSQGMQSLNRHNRNLLFLLLAVGVLPLTAGAAHAADKARRPNVVILLADDL